MMLEAQRAVLSPNRQYTCVGNVACPIPTMLHVQGMCISQSDCRERNHDAGNETKQSPLASSSRASFAKRSRLASETKRTGFNLTS